MTIADIEGPGVIRHIWITVPDSTAAGNHVFRDVTLRMYWDGTDAPSVEVPLGDYFCNGHATRCLVDSLPVVVVPDGGLNCYFPMPFASAAELTIESDHPGDIPALFYQVDYSLLDAFPDDAAYFHAQWRRENPTTETADFTILDGVEGRGHYVGIFLAWTALEGRWCGEGEVKFYLDDEHSTICGTGTEDYVGGAWCFNDPTSPGTVDDSKQGAERFPEPLTYSTPFVGYPFFDVGGGGQGHPPRHDLYRWHLPDPVHFRKSIRATVQQIGHDGDVLFERSDDVSSVAYWYQSEPFTDFPVYPDSDDRRPRDI